MRRFFYALTLLTLAFSSVAEDKEALKFKAKSKLDFETLLIEGEEKKPGLSVVTGNLGEKDFGLLKIRAQFHDAMTDDIGEEI